MALQDILAAITAEADQNIANARAEHARVLSSMRDESERNLAKKKQDIAMSKAKKMEQLEAKANVHAQTHKRNSILAAKKEVLDDVFTKAVDALSKVNEKDAEMLLRACLKRIDSKGSIFPSALHAALLKKICPSEQFTVEKPTQAKGGFLFVSPREEQDYTFESIIQHIVRPSHELSVASILFS